MKPTSRIRNLRQSDRKHLVREEDAEPIAITRSEGSYLYASDGRRYLDFVMGWCVGNQGWGNEEIRAAIRDFKGPDYVAPGQLYKPWGELAELLASIAPGDKLVKCLRTTGGSESVDLALRAAVAHTGRRKFVSIDDAYHGNSMAASAVGSGGSKAEQERPFLRCARLKPPLDNQAAVRLERLLKRRDVAAFIMEPVICNRAVLAPERDFMMRAQALCRKYGTLLIMDEVATGFGRTGKIFATEHFGIEPDLLTMAKALSGGYAPIGAVLMTEELADSVREAEMNEYSTYGWHPISVAASLANVKLLIREKEGILKHVNRLGDYFLQRLSAIEFKSAPRITVVGLAIGLEFDGGDHASRIAERAKENGLLVSELSEDSLAMFPALNLEPESARRGLDIFEECCATRKSSSARAA